MEKKHGKETFTIGYRLPKSVFFVNNKQTLKG